jgi:hypothetical protein
VTVKEIVLLILGPAYFGLFVWLLPQWWRNERGIHPQTPPPDWPWSGAFWRSLVRLWGPVTYVCLVGIPATIVTIFVSEGLLSDITLAITGIVGWTAIFVLPSVWLFNRPRFLLPPHLRALPGWLADRRGAPVPPVPEPAKPPRWHAAPR